MSKKPKKQQRPVKPKRRSHHPTIWEVEAPLPLELPSEVSSIFEEIATAAPAIPFEEIGWIGGKTADEPGMAAKVDKLILGDLTFYSALELIMLGIIRGHPTKATSARVANNATEQRLKVTIKQLTGKKPTKGPAHSSDMEWVCTAAAHIYARQAMGYDKKAEDQHLSPILQKILASRLKGKSTKEQYDFITPYRNFFYNHQTRLLMKVTWSSSEEQKTRRYHIRRILHSLRMLGVPVDSDSVKKQLEVPSLKSTVE
jgi:hypothetical protein